MARQSQQEIDSMIQRCKPKNRDLVRRDILQALQSPTGNLVLKISSYYFNDGSSRELLCLGGTVATNYKNNRYNIPIELWLTDDHPHAAPMAYVKPTPDMYVAARDNVVEPDGKIILQYMKQWRHPNADLPSLLSALSEAFSQSPPVYSNPGAARPSLNNQPAAQNTTPYPLQTNMPTPQPYMGGGGGGAARLGNSSAATPYPNTYPGSFSGMPSYPNYAGPTPGHSSTPQQQIPEQIYRESLISAVLDRCRTRFNDISQQTRAEIESLRRTEEDLSGGQRKLDTLLVECQQQETQLTNYMLALRGKIDEMKLATGKMTKATGGVEQHALKDDAIVTPAPIFKQLLQAYAEDHAIQDLLYYLGDGIRRKSISIETYLKHVRELSRRQFILRATMHKCRQIAGLPVK